MFVVELRSGRRGTHYNSEGFCQGCGKAWGHGVKTVAPRAGLQLGNSFQAFQDTEPANPVPRTEFPGLQQASMTHPQVAVGRTWQWIKGKELTSTNFEKPCKPGPKPLALNMRLHSKTRMHTRQLGKPSKLVFPCRSNCRGQRKLGQATRKVEACHT